MQSVSVINSSEDKQLEVEKGCGEGGKQQMTADTRGGGACAKKDEFRGLWSFKWAETSGRERSLKGTDRNTGIGVAIGLKF